MLIQLGRGRMETDYRGISMLAKLHANILAAHNSDELFGQKCSIDASDIQWMDAHLGAPLQLIVRAFKGSATFSMPNLRSDIRDILGRNGTFTHSKPDTKGTTSPITSFSRGENIKFAGHSKSFLKRDEMPKMTEDLEKKIFEAIDEIFENYCLHSQTERELICAGQFFPQKHKLVFCMCDAGIGIPENIRSAGFATGSDAELIDWAMTPNNTTRQGDIPGGLGLGLLQEFLKLNKGRLVISANKGYWEQTPSGQTLKRTLSDPFPGTLAILEINTADKRSYQLKREIDPRDIW